MSSAGHAGLQSRDFWAPVEEWFFTSRPDVVVLLLGANDLLKNKYDPRRVHRSSGELSDLIDKVLKYSPKATVLVCSLVPMRHPPEDFGKFNKVRHPVSPASLASRS